VVLAGERARTTSNRLLWSILSGPAPFPPPGPPQPYYVLQVPPPDFLAQNGATYGNYWWIARTPTNGWVIPTPIQPNIPPHGTWFSWNVKSRGTLWRVLNLDNNNPVGIPILGSYYMAYLPGFTATGPLNLLSLISGTQYPGGPPSQMVSQRDIQYAMANPLSSAPCTLAQIQALIPGISYPLPQPPLPAWTDKTYIEGMTIGCDPIPYWTQVWYWWKYRHQRTSFVGYGVEAGTGTYNDRIDNVLYADFFTSPVYKSNGQGQWLFDQCLLLYKGRPCYPGVGLPRPDFVSADHGVVKATVSGNPDFGLDPEQTMSMIAVSMPRGANKNGIDVTSLFWFWFTDDQKGVLFSEGNYIDTVVDHDLQVIDYMYFEQNASDRVNEGSFSDPCKVDQCPSEPSARVTRHPGF
jgi:hypothetical protein